MQIWPGQPYPLGATFDGTGTNFAIYSSVAERVELILLDSSDAQTVVDMRDTIRPFLCGAIGLVVESGRMDSNEVVVAPAYV